MSILKELRVHAPFTIFGALTGVVLITFFQAMPGQSAYNVFYVLHPIHMIMAVGEKLTWVSFSVIFVFLFLAVWLPCCVSDIVFPLGHFSRTLMFIDLLWSHTMVEAVVCPACGATFLYCHHRPGKSAPGPTPCADA